MESLISNKPNASIEEQKGYGAVKAGFVVSIVLLAVSIGLLLLEENKLLVEWMRMQTWEEAPARMALFVGDRRNRESDSEWRATVFYRYLWNGDQGSGNRIAINEENNSNNLYPKQLIKELRVAHRERREFTVWVNRLDPRESVYNRDLPLDSLKLSGFVTLALMGFGLMGILLSFFHLMRGFTANSSSQLLPLSEMKVPVEELVPVNRFNTFAEAKELIRKNVAKFIVGTVFSAAGLYIFTSFILVPMWEWQEMRGWQPVTAELLSVDLKRQRSDNSSTWQATARYSYRWHGEGSRVSIHKVVDNISRYKKDMARKLEWHLLYGDPITVWVNPQSPDESIIDRDIRWDGLFFAMVFSLFSSGIGFGILFVEFIHHSGYQQLAEMASKVWLSKKKWASPGIASSGKTRLYVIWGFAVITNFVAVFALFAIPAHLAKGNAVALFLAYFPVMGIVILGIAIHDTLRWIRFGKVLFQMDPYPGAIGGHVGGYLDVLIPYNSSHLFLVTLSLVHSSTSRSGDDIQTTNIVEWQRDGIAKTESYGSGTRVFACFDVPKGLQESQSASEDYYYWKLSVKAELEGVDFSEDFELPVFATEEHSGAVVENTPTNAATVDRNYQQIEELVNMVPVPGGVEWTQPAGTDSKAGLSNMLFGGIFCGFGIIFGMVDQWFSWGVFLVCELVGIPFLAGGLFMLLTSLYVRIDGSGLCRIRSIFGITLGRQQLQPTEISGFAIVRGVSSDEMSYYNLDVKTHQGKQYRIANGFKGEVQAKLALEAIRAAMPFPIPQGAQSSDR